MIHNLVSKMLSEEHIEQIVAVSAKLSAYIKNSGLNNKFKTSLELYTKTRWNSVFTMIDAIITEYQAIYDLLVYKQRVLNEDRFKRNKQPKNNITDLITVLKQEELIEIRNFLEPFKVGFEKNQFNNFMHYNL